MYCSLSIHMSQSTPVRAVVHAHPASTESTGKNTLSIHSLPDDILLEIFETYMEFLDSSARHLVLVARRWANVAQSASKLWSGIYFDSSPERHTAETSYQRCHNVASFEAASYISVFFDMT